MDKQRTYIAIDLKSFYASVECVERGLNPLCTNLVVADKSRTEKTICLAVSPALKEYGIPGRARLFEVVQAVQQINTNRRVMNNYKPFCAKSYDANALKDINVELDYIIAPPRMNLYIDYSTRVYKVYLRYVAPEDIHVYSIDEVFMDVTDYMYTNKMTAHQMAMAMIKDVLAETGITATAGIGTNMYLCKVAMDIVAKHIPPDSDGVRIAELDEMAYRKKLWNHRPLTDFWRIGRGYAKKLEANNLYTMGDIARCSLGKDNEYYSEKLLYKLFGVNAELLIDHAWGWEPCTINDVKSYKPHTNSISSGQVLKEPYSYDKAKIIIKEMAQLLSLDLVDKGLLTNQVVLTVGYDINNIKLGYTGAVSTDHYGRAMPKHAHGTFNIESYTASTKLLTNAVMQIFNRVVDDTLYIRRINISANNVVDNATAKDMQAFEQLNLFTDYAKKQYKSDKLKKEKSLQLAMLKIQKRYGKNAILIGTNLLDGATTMERNCQVGGHRA